MRRSAIRTFIQVIFIFAPILLAGCATSTPAPVSDTTPTPSGEEGEAPDVRQALYAQLERWRGTRYRLGGLGRKGIDCSGLTYVVYRDVFGTHLPRTTEKQGKMGRSVSRGDLAPGDLVFFRTGLVQKHVGIYLDNGRFLHASRSNGVRLSTLSNGYWRERYWKARRMASTM